ncbi:MAG: hypothetical protein J5644_07980 [Bacteroidales bacterium]|nr:hypothetical protein [Bacteroidales bacterium]
MKKILFSTILCLALCLMLDNTTWGQTALNKGTTTNISSTGTKTYYTPTGYKITKIEAWGAGGGGAYNYQTSNPGGGRGGGGGGYAAVSPTDIPFGSSKTISVTIGAGGNGGKSSSKTGGNGGPSYVSYGGTEYVRANFGYAGGNSSGAGGQGGSSAKGLSVTGHNGGSGGTPSYTSALGQWGMYSGGGGGGAGDSGNGASGNNASTGGNGGSSSKTSSNPGSNQGQGGQGGGSRKIGWESNSGDPTGGSDYGGGGGGTTHGTAGKGGNGFVRITTVACSVNVTYDANTTDAVTWNASTWGNSSTHSYGRTYDGNVSAFDFNAGSALSRSGYIFLGFYTAATGGTKVTYTTKITTSNFSTLTWNGTANLTGNLTLYAHWAYAGAIANGSTNITPCGDYTIYNNTAPDAVDGLTYSWSYSYNGGTPVELNKDYMQPTGTQLGLSLNQPGDYVFTRYVHALNQTVASDNSYTVHVAYSAGSITQATVDQVSGEPVEVTGTAVDNSVYRWKCNGTLISSATNQNLSIAANTVCAPGTYVYTREAKKNGCDMEWEASANSYTVTITEVNPGEIAADTIYLCAAGNFSIGSTADASTTPASTIVYEWRYSKDGGAETPVANSDKNTLTQVDVTLSEGVYVFKRYAKVGCADWVAATGSYTLNVVALPASYPAPAANFTNLCVGGKWVVTGGDYTLTGVVSPDNVATSFEWMISEDGSAAASAGGSANLEQVLDATGNYTVYAVVEYFNQSACVVNTGSVSVTVIDDPTIAVPTLSAASICPDGEVTLTAASIVGGVGDGYAYNWEFKAAGSDIWKTVSATDESEATYSQAEGEVVTASNFFSTGAVQYRSYVSNAQGCDAHSPAADLNIIVVETPDFRDTTVCPVADQSIEFQASTTDPTFFLRWYQDQTTTNYTGTTPSVPMDNELETTYYVAQYNPKNACVSARVPVSIVLTYSAHLQYVDASGDLDQTVCQNSPIVDVQFNHGGDCEPQITFDPEMPPAGVTIDNSVAGVTTITGTPTEAGTFTYHVALLPDGSTKCAAPNDYDGTITVNPVYNVVDNQTICSGSYTVSDNKDHSFSHNTSGTYVHTLESVLGCDSVVTLNLYVHEWNQFGFEANEKLIAGWTNFSSVSSPINADVTGSASGSQITYSGWNGSNSNSQGNLTPSTSSMITAGGKSLGLINHNSGNTNNGKNIVLKTTTAGYGNLKLHFDYGAQRTHAWGTYSDNDKAFTSIKFYYSLDGTNWTAFTQGGLSVKLEQAEVTYGSHEVNLSKYSTYKTDNAQNLYIRFEFDGSDHNALNTRTNYFLLDNICISGTKAIDEIELSRADETKPCCTNQPLTLMATAPYINTNVEPEVQTPVIYKWERIVGGVSTVLDETSYVLTDNDVQEGYYQYVVSVGEAPCGKSDTLNVLGIKPAYHMDIVRHGTVCSNEVDKVINITPTDNWQYEPGMFIVTPSANEMRIPGIYECELSIPSTENPCDSVIKLMLEVLKSFDTTVVANICLGETYDQYGFNITPTEEGTTYHLSDPSWTCSTGCDSIYRLTLVTSSVRQALTPEFNVTLAAWPMDNDVTTFKPACGKRTTGSSFSVFGVSDDSEHVPGFENVSGHTPSSDYCYAAASNNGALQFPNLWSDCSGLWGSEKYASFSGTYFEIKLNPYDHNNLRLMFDYKRENASTNNAQAFNQVRYSYKFSETGSYTVLGTANLNSTDWASQTLNFSGANGIIDQEVVYLKVEFIGGNRGNTESCGLANGSQYLPSYITVDNMMILADRPVRAHLDGTAQTCNKTYVCEGEEVTFTCQGDDDHFHFFVLDEANNTEIPFNNETTLALTPSQTNTYYIKAVEQNTLCDSVWGPFNVEVVKTPTISYVSGSSDEGICGSNAFDIEIAVKDAASYTFKWLTSDNATPEGVVYNNNNGTITIGGQLTDGGSARYLVTANPDDRCSSVKVSQQGTLSSRMMPKIVQTIGKDSVCQDAAMQFVVDTTGLNFTLVPEDQRFKWFTADVTLGIKDTLSYTADETTHSTRHYIQVKQNGCTTLDSLDIVVLDLAGDTLRTEDMTYTFNYGDNYLSADSLKLPDLMHKGEPVQANFIATVEHTGGNKLYPPSMDDMNLTITWTITDSCGNVHVKDQKLHFILPPCGGDMTVTDKDGNVYQTVRMGLNCWMQENLKTTKYADESDIPVARGYVGGDYNDEDANVAKFGRLYTWYSAVKIPEDADASVLPQVNEFGHVQGVCPDGWCLPDRESFASLRDIDMNRMRKAGDEYWYDGGGNNTTQFSLVGAGFYNNASNRCENLLGDTYYWTSEVYDDVKVKSFTADCNCYTWIEIFHEKGSAFSVRCVKDKE